MKPDEFFLLGIIVLGVGTALEDARSHRISNGWIAAALAYTTAVQLAASFYGGAIEPRWALLSIVNILVSACVSVFFWKKKWWGGGDAKLFVCYAALIPLQRYPLAYFKYYFAAFLLLLLIFLPSTFWIFCCAQKDSWDRRSTTPWVWPPKERREDFYRLLASFIGLFFLSGLTLPLLVAFLPGFRSWPMVLWLAGLFFYKEVFRFFHQKPWLVLVLWALCATASLLMPRSYQGNVGPALGRSLLMSLVLVVARLYVFRSIEAYISRTRKEYMAFAGWMFAGALALWFSKDLIFAARLMVK